MNFVSKTIVIQQFPTKSATHFPKNHHIKQLSDIIGNMLIILDCQMFVYCIAALSILIIGLLYYSVHDFRKENKAIRNFIHKQKVVIQDNTQRVTTTLGQLNDQFIKEYRINSIKCANNKQQTNHIDQLFNIISDYWSDLFSTDADQDRLNELAQHIFNATKEIQVITKSEPIVSKK